MKKRFLIAALAFSMLLLVVSCAGVGSAQDDASAPGPTGPAAPQEDPTPPSEDRSARTLAVPGTTADPGPPDGTAASAPGGLAWDVPEAWSVEQPASSMRYAQYGVPGPGGDAQCVVYYFGPGQGGDARANAVRWANQFRQPDGRSSVDLMKTTELDGVATPVTVVEVTGTYDGGMAMTMQPAEELADYMLLAGIAAGPDAPWFFKLTGPETTVRAARADFESLLRSLRIAER